MYVRMYVGMYVCMYLMAPISSFLLHFVAPEYNLLGLSDLWLYILAEVPGQPDSIRSNGPGQSKLFERPACSSAMLQRAVLQG